MDDDAVVALLAAGLSTVVAGVTGILFGPWAALIALGATFAVLFFFLLWLIWV